MDAIHDTLVQMPIDEFEGFIEDLKDFIYSLDDSYYFAKAPVNEIIDIYKNIERFISTTITVLTSILDEKTQMSVLKDTVILGKTAFASFVVCIIMSSRTQFLI